MVMSVTVGVMLRSVIFLPGLASMGNVPTVNAQAVKSNDMVMESHDRRLTLFIFLLLPFETRSLITSLAEYPALCSLGE